MAGRYTCLTLVDGRPCSADCGSGAGLASHQRAAHRELAAPMPPRLPVPAAAVPASSSLTETPTDSYNDDDGGGGYDSPRDGDRDRDGDGDHDGAARDSASPAKRRRADLSSDEDGSGDEFDRDDDDDVPFGWLHPDGADRADELLLRWPERRATAYSVVQQDLTDWLLRAGASEGLADELLQILAVAAPGELAELPLRVRTLYSRLSAVAASARRVPLQFTSVALEGARSASVQIAHYDLWRVLHAKFLTDPARAPHLVWGFHRDLTPRGVRVFSEMWTGDWWHDAALRHPGRDVLGVLLHIDDTPVAGRSVTPVYITVGNLPRRLRQQDGAMEPVAYFPVLQGTDRERTSESFRRRRRAYLHDALKVVLASLETALRTGPLDVYVNGSPRRVVPLLAVIVADNDEKGRLALCYNKYNSERPCVACMVENRHLGNARFTSAVPAARRTAAASRQLRAEYVALSASRRKHAIGTAKRLETSNSMHLDVDNATWTLPGFEVYQSMPSDRLHDFDLGVLKALVLALLAHLKELGGPDVVNMLDHRLRALTTPRIPHVKSFGAAGFTGLQRVEGAHYRALVQLLPVALADLHACVTDELVDLVVSVHALYEDSRKTAITATDLETWQGRAAAWAADFQRLLAVRFMGSEGAFPKLHMLLGGHLPEAVRRYGVPANYDAGPFEKAHVLRVKRHAGNVSRGAPLAGQLAQREDRVAAAAAAVATSSKQRGADAAATGASADGTFGSLGTWTWAAIASALGIATADLADLVRGASPGQADAAEAETFMRTRIGPDAHGDVVHANAPRFDHVELEGSTRERPRILHVRTILRPTRIRHGLLGADARQHARLRVLLLGRELRTRPLTHFGKECFGGRALVASDGPWAVVAATAATRRAAVTSDWPDRRTTVGPGERIVNNFVFVYDISTDGPDADTE